MSKAIPSMQKFMTHVPSTIDYNDPISRALDLLQKHGVRHLPVTKGGKVYGILSEREIKSAMGYVGSDPARLKVGDICENNPFTVSPHSPIDEVAEVMAERKLGSALIVDNDKLVGIFTVTDALKALTQITRSKFHS